MPLARNSGQLVDAPSENTTASDFLMSSAHARLAKALAPGGLAGGFLGVYL